MNMTSSLMKSKRPCQFSKIRLVCNYGKKMKKNKTPSLIKTNPYLQDPAECDVWLTRAVISSSAIEGVGAAACRALGVAGQAKKTKVACIVSTSSRSRG